MNNLEELKIQGYDFLAKISKELPWERFVTILAFLGIYKALDSGIVIKKNDLEIKIG